MANQKGLSLSGFRRRPYLHVLSGVHAGIVVEVDTATCRIGASDRSDIVLGDPGIAQEHMIVRLYGSRVAVEATGADVSVDGQFIDKGNGQRAVLPVDIELGSTRIRLARDKLFNLSSQLRARLQAGVAALAAFAAVAALVYYNVDVKRASASASPAHVSTVTDTRGDSRPANDAPRHHSASQDSAARRALTSDAIDRLKRQIADHGLGGLSVKNSGNRITVKGDVPTAARSNWTAIQKWFDSHYSDSHVLISSVRTVSESQKPDLRFKAVWFGDHPYVVDGSGERRYPGASLSDGWVLDNLRNHRITVRRNGQKFRLTF